MPQLAPSCENGQNQILIFINLGLKMELFITIEKLKLSGQKRKLFFQKKIEI